MIASRVAKERADAQSIADRINLMTLQFERNVGENTPIGLPRGTNNLWTNGGLMYAPPVR